MKKTPPPPTGDHTTRQHARIGRRVARLLDRDPSIDTVFSIATWPQTLAGEPGWSYEIRDGNQRLHGEGWSRGRKQHALDDARAQIARLQRIDRRAS